MFHKDKKTKDGLFYRCKKCVSDYQKKYRDKNKELIKERARRYYENGGKEKKREYDRKRMENEEIRRKSSEYHSKYWEEHKDRIKQYRKEYGIKKKDEIAKKRHEYYVSHRADIEAYYKRDDVRKRRAYVHKSYQLSRRNSDPLFKLTWNVRNNIRKAFNSRGYKKSKSTEGIVGCSTDFLIEHLKKTYLERYGEEYVDQEVHIDHIIPLKTARNETEMIELCHYSNLQLLTPKDNLVKGDRYTKEGD